MADIDNLKGGTKRVVEENTPLNNLRGGTKRVVIVDGGGGGSSLPDQTGQSGKFLTTDGTDASWSDKPLVNTATADRCLIIAGNGGNYTASTTIGVGAYAYGNYSIILGANASGNVGKNNVVVVGQNAGGLASSCVAVGYQSACRGDYSIAIGPESKTNNNATHAIQIGSTGSATYNSDANTFKVANANGNFEIMSADGTVPTARLTKVNTTATLAVADWSSNTQTVSVTGITANGVVLVSPTPANQSAYTSAGILCTSQAAGTLTFTCDTVPSADITVTVVML